jgi:hypothetical protein
MRIRTHARILAMGSLFALAVLAVPATHVQAKPKRSPDPGVRCYLQDYNGVDYDFYLPGAVVTLPDGKQIRCNSNGVWVVLITSGLPSTVGAVGSTSYLGP